MILVSALTLGGTSLFAISPIKDNRDAISRLHDRETHMMFEMVGRGSSSKWCLKGVANFNYTVVVDAESRIVEKTKLPGGEYQIVELHKIRLAADKLGVSEEDLIINLKDFDSENFDKFFNTACAIFAGLGAPEVSLELLALKKISDETLKKFDGVSVGKTLEQLGIPAKDLIRSGVISILQQAFSAKIRSATGKSYKVVYTLNKNRQPIAMRYTYADDKPVTDDEERKILDRLNVFIDTHTVPDRKCRVGDTWTIQAEDIQQVMDPYVDGNYVGDISVVRLKDDADKTWNLAMKEAKISILNKEEGNVTGNIALKKGTGKVDPKNCTVETVYVEGTAKLNRVSRHHWLFYSRIDGWCKFSGKLHSIRLK